MNLTVFDIENKVRTINNTFVQHGYAYTLIYNEKSKTFTLTKVVRGIETVYHLSIHNTHEEARKVIEGFSNGFNIAIDMMMNKPDISHR